MGARGLWSLNKSFSEGRVHEQIVTKTSSPSMPARMWADLSMGAGIPRYNAYVGPQGVGTPLVGEGNFGIYTGASLPTESTYLTKALFIDTTAGRYPGSFLLGDYLYFYPLIDGDNTDTQELDSTLAVPRLSKQGAQLALVCTTPALSGLLVTATITYRNQDDVVKQTTCRIVSFAQVGHIAHTHNGGQNAEQSSPFIALADNDTGVNSVVDIRFSNPSGGFFALVLVSKLAAIHVFESSTPTEYEFPLQKSRCVEIRNGAYLNFFGITTSAGTILPRIALEFLRV